ncbi:MAG: YIP1 family protein [Amaricoccus sp.]
MRRGIVDRIGLTWRAPRAAMAAERAAGLDERRALMDLVLACLLLFVASMPNALREARGLAVDDPVSAAVSAHLFGYVALLPLAAYGLAAVTHLAARAFGGHGSFLAARSALFLSGLAAAPVALAVAAVGVAAEAQPGLSPAVAVLRFAALGFGLWLFAGTLAEAEGFATGRVAAVLAAGCFGGLLALAAAAGVV